MAVCSRTGGVPSTAGSWRPSSGSTPTGRPSTSTGWPTMRFGAKWWGKAVTYLRQAGAKALTRSAHREALGYFEQTLTALTHLPETRETLEQAIDVRFDLRNALVPFAEFERIEGYLGEAEVLARTLDDQRRLGWVSTYMAAYHLNAGGRASDVRRFAQTAETIGERL